MKTPINYLTRIRYAFGDVKTQSFYRRQIPPHLITFASPEGRPYSIQANKSSEKAWTKDIAKPSSHGSSSL